MSPAHSIASTIRSLDPGVFAMVMATGIVSLGLDIIGLHTLARVLLALNALLWTGLIAMTLARLFSVPGQLWQDLRNPAKGAGFLTFAAGTLVLSSQCRLLLNLSTLATVLTWLGILAWLLLSYLFLVLAITLPQKPTLPRSLHGGWLILVVATQAVAIGLLEMQPATTLWLLLGWCSFLVGSFLYLLLITLLFRRLLFDPMEATDLTPPYWINMGALAISTLAGSLWIQLTPPLSPLSELQAFTHALTLALWAIASWWIPLLVLLGIWRHGVKRVPLRYQTAYWNIVFPLGMYAVATHQLAQVLKLDFLAPLTPVAVLIGLAAWLLTAASGLLLAITRNQWVREKAP